MTKYQIKKKYKDIKYKVHITFKHLRNNLSDFKNNIKKRINIHKLSKRFYLLTLVIFMLIFALLIVKPSKPQFNEVEIINMDNYSFQILSNDVIQTIPFQKVKFKTGQNKTILINNTLYIYKTHYYIKEANHV